MNQEQPNTEEETPLTPEEKELASLDDRRQKIIENELIDKKLGNKTTNESYKEALLKVDEEMKKKMLANPEASSSLYSRPKYKERVTDRKEEKEEDTEKERV